MSDILNIPASNELRCFMATATVSKEPHRDTELAQGHNASFETQRKSISED